MELQFFGANCIRLTSKKASIIIDDNLRELGAKSVTKPGDIVLYTSLHRDPGVDAKLVVGQPGEYEISDISITGIAARAHIDEAGKRTATIFRIVGDDIRIAVLGHVHPDFDDEQLEALGAIDVLIIPVGGFGYTLDPVGALKVIREISPKVVIPTHYADPSLSYPVPQQDLDSAIKALGMEPRERVSKFKAKDSQLAENTQLVILEK